LATFKEQVEGITSISIGATPTNDELSQFLVDGTREVINRIITARPDEAVKFTSSTNDASDAGILLTGQVISVVREHDSTSILRECSPISPGDRYAASDSTSLKYRSKYNPGFYVLDGKIHTIPASAGSDNDSIVTQVYYAINTGWSSSGIQNFPDEYEYLVALYASFRSLHALMGSKSIPVEAVLLDIPILSITASVPTGLSLPVISFTDISDIDTGSVSDIVATTVDITSATQPSYNSGAVFGDIASTLPTALTLDPINITAIPPDIPTVPGFTITTSSSLPTYSAPTTINGDAWVTTYPNQYAAITTALTAVPVEIAVAKAELAELISDTDSSSSGFVTALASAVNELDKVDNVIVEASNEFDGAVGNLNITAVAPGEPEIQAVTYETGGTASVEDIALVQNVSLPSSPPLFTEPSFPSRPTIEGSISDQDIEMSGAKIQQYQIDLQAFQAQLANNQAEFTEATTLYQAEMQKAVADAQAANNKELADAQAVNTKHLADYQSDQVDRQQTVQAIIQDNQANFTTWQQSLAQYQAEVSSQIQEYTQEASTRISKGNAFLQEANSYLQQAGGYINEINARGGFAGVKGSVVGNCLQTASSYISEVTARLSLGSNAINEYNARIGAELNEFNANLQKYQGEITSQLQKSQYEQQQEHAAQLQQYQAEVAVYQAEVGTTVQNYTQYLAENQAEYSSGLQKYQANLQDHSQKMQDALNLFNEQNVEYQAEVQSQIQQAQITNQESLQNMQKALQIALRDADKEQEHKFQAKIQDMQAVIASNQDLVAKYQAELSFYSAVVNKDIQEYATQVQTFQADAGAQTAKYQAELQAYQAEYAWLQDQYARLKQEYDTSFIALAPPKQESSAQQQPRA